MKKVFILIAVITVLVASCTPQSIANEQSVDKDKIERPGSQGGS